MKRKGEITVFLSLTLTLISAVICVLIETARTTACGFYFQTAVQSGLESCFGEYCRPLWEEYRLLAFYEEESLETRLEEYLESYRQPAGEGITFLTFSEPEIRREGCGYLTEQGGWYLQENGADYMKYHVTADALGELISDTDLVRQVRSAADFVKTLSEYSEDILKAEEQIREIRDLAESLTASAHETAQELQNLTAVLRETAGQMAEGLPWEEAREKMVFVTTGYLSRLRVIKEQQSGVLMRFWQEAEEYGTLAEGLRGKLQETAEEFEQGGYTGEIRRQMEEQVDNIRAYASGEGNRWQELEELKAGLGRLEEISDICQTMEQWDFSEEVSFSEVLARAEDVAARAAGYEQIHLPDWMEELGTLSASEEEYPKSRLKGLGEEALLRYFVGEEAVLSEASLSENDVVNVEGEAEEEGFLSQAGREMLFFAYLGECFSCFTEPLETHHMQYEQEFLLGGKMTDRENLLYTAGELLLMREGIRFLEYLTDGAKQKEAAAAAAAVVGITGSPILIKLLQTAILAVWALNDAAADVQALMQGKELPLLILSGKEWADLDYSDHLKILFVFTGNRRILPRCLSLIQATMRDGEPGFRVEKCLYEAEVCVEAESGSVFGRLFVVRKLWERSEWGKEYQIRERYSYDS